MCLTCLRWWDITLLSVHNDAVKNKNHLYHVWHSKCVINLCFHFKPWWSLSISASYDKQNMSYLGSNYVKAMIYVCICYLKKKSKYNNKKNQNTTSKCFSLLGLYSKLHNLTVFMCFVIKHHSATSSQPSLTLIWLQLFPVGSSRYIIYYFFFKF